MSNEEKDLYNRIIKQYKEFDRFLNMQKFYNYF